MQDHNLLDEQQFNRMVKRVEKNYEKDSPKLLNGLDSAILMYVNEIALASVYIVIGTSDAIHRLDFVSRPILQQISSMKIAAISVWLASIILPQK